MIKAQNRKFLLLPGDGVGPEVVGLAVGSRVGSSVVGSAVVG